LHGKVLRLEGSEKDAGNAKIAAPDAAESVFHAKEWEFYAKGSVDLAKDPAVHAR
jgi:hypothetical protein